MYGNNLAPIFTRKIDVNNDSDLYMYGFTICDYLSILCHERIENEVTMYTCEEIIVSHSDANKSEMLKTGSENFCVDKCQTTILFYFQFIRIVIVM